jgi:hypothetical protein
VVPFATSVVLLILGAVLASRLRPDIPFERPIEAKIPAQS